MGSTEHFQMLIGKLLRCDACPPVPRRSVMRSRIVPTLSIISDRFLSCSSIRASFLCRITSPRSTAVPTSFKEAMTAGTMATSMLSSLILRKLPPRNGRTLSTKTLLSFTRPLIQVLAWNLSFCRGRKECNVRSATVLVNSFRVIAAGAVKVFLELPPSAAHFSTTSSSRKASND